jgi:hypothetical protein
MSIAAFGGMRRPTAAHFSPRKCRVLEHPRTGSRFMPTSYSHSVFPTSLCVHTIVNGAKNTDKFRALPTPISHASRQGVWISLLKDVRHPLYLSTTSTLIAMPALNVTLEAGSRLLYPVAFFANSPPAPRIRTIYDILWSCLLTIFACTWTSLHPNIWLGPTLFESIVWKILLMGMALLAPELVVLWAIRQWAAARDLANQYKGIYFSDRARFKFFSSIVYQDFGWTQTHGHFAIMGGFLFMARKEDPDELGAIASPYQEPLKTLIKNNMTHVTEAFITDKSKGDFISKSLVIFQTLWFISQFCARVHQNLPVTELELVTFGYTIVNLATYFFWWNKPQNVGCPIRVYAEDLPYQKDHDRLRSSDDGGSDYPLSCHCSKSGLVATVSDALVSTKENSPGRVREGHIFDIPTVETIKNRRNISFFSFAYQAATSHEGALTMGSDIVDDSNGFFTDYTRWYTGRPTKSQSLIIFAVPATLACALGGLHLAAWKFNFPTPTERLIWRTAAVIVTVVPAYCLAISLSFLVLRDTTDSIDNALCSVVLMPLMIAVYVVSRIILLVQVFILLRNASPEVYQTISWIHYIPHF